MSTQPHTTVPGLDEGDANVAVSQLENRLVALIDLQLVLKHIHWNVVGPNFLSVHEMLDEQVEPTREMTDAVAERIATLGGVPNGNAGHVVESRDWQDYALGRTDVFTHLEALDAVYSGVIADHRRAIAVVADADPVTEDLLIGQTAKLELFQWFVRSFIERAGGDASAIARSTTTTRAGRGPSSHEAEIADRNAASIDTDAVAEPYRERTRTGASVNGEGRIV